MIKFSDVDVKQFILSVKNLSNYQALLDNVDVEFSPMTKEEKLFLVNRNHEEFSFYNDTIQSYFELWCMAKITKRDYVFGQAKIGLSKSKNEDGIAPSLLIKKIDHLGLSAENVGDNVAHLNPIKNNQQFDDIVIHCKSREQLDKLYNVLMDKE